MIQVVRCRAYEDHSKRKKQAVETARKEQQGAQPDENPSKALFDQKKKKTAIKLNVAAVPFQIKIDYIGASLQLQNFDFLYQQLYNKLKIAKDCPITDPEFHSGLQYLIQILYIIRDMASSDDEKNQKNARILQTNVFYRDLCPIACHAFKIFDPKFHSF